MGKKKGKKVADCGADDHQLDDLDGSTTGLDHDHKDQLVGGGKLSESQSGDVQGRLEKGKVGKKKGKKKHEWEDFDMEEALSEVVEDKATDKESKKAKKGDISVDKDVVSEPVQADKKEQGPKSLKKGKKGKKDNWQDFDMEEALSEALDEKPVSVQLEKEGKKGRKVKDEETTVERSSLVEMPKDVCEKQIPMETPPVESPLGTPVKDPIATETPKTENSATAMDVDDKEEDDKKKKKKKKKLPGEKDEKKPKKSAVGTAIKKRLEAVRAAQKLREEEERKRMEAEEEAERKRLEELRIAEEKKQRKKQKEKERIERLKKEGKYLTKSEKEKKAKQKASLEALKAQGIDIPGLKQPVEGDRKPVRYGSRVRPKKKDSSLPQSATAQPSTDILDKTSKDCEHQDGLDEVKESSDVIEDWEVLDDDSHVVEKWDEVQSVSGGEDDGEDKKEPPTTEDLPVEDKLSSTSAMLSTEDKTMEMDKVTSEVRDLEVEEESTSSEEGSDEEPEQVFRSPVVCVLGHVDTGKTKILDKIRRTNVQDGEAGGITQQIGATFVPQSAIQDQTRHLKEFSHQALMIPGLLIIDTPGHESFSNLRTRGSSLCDIAILVVDIMHGLEPQTIESINILKRGRVPFIIALNKVDRLLDWKRSPTLGIRDNLKKQKVVASSQFEELYQQVIVQFAEQELNVSLFWNKVNFKEYIPVCPTSAMSGDGMGDLMALLTTVCQKHLLQQLQFSEDLECHVLEVKAISGLGMTIDVILRNGFLKEGDTIVLCGVDGPFTTQIRALLTPQPLRELRVKNTYIQHKLLAGAQGIKLTGKELEKALAGTPLFVASSPEDVEPLKDKAQSTLSATLNAVKCQDIGVYVQASTLGSLEALVEFLKHSKIPYSGVNIGPVHKKDVMKASVMLEHKNDYAVILAFDVKIEREAQEMADSLGVRIFSADIIYHLFDSFMKYREELRQRLREQYKDIAIFPCKLKILPNCVFKTRDPIVVGVKVEGGLVKVGTPLTVPSKNFCDIGIVSSMEANHKPVDVVKKGAEVCLKIDPIPGEAPRLLGRHFDEADLIVSKISRQSIDAVKDYFREDLQKGDWQLMVELKKQFQIL